MGVRLLAPGPRTVLDEVRLDPEQARAVAVRQGDGPLVVLGAPGTGTTTVLVESVAARVLRDGVRPDGVLVLAPSRAAAAALRQRIGQRLSRTVREPLARTAHSYAFGLLRRALVLDGDVPPRLISGPEQDRILADLLEGHVEGAGRPVAWPPELTPQVRGLAGFRAELRDVLMRAVERGLDGGSLAELGRRHGRPEWVSAAAVLEEYLEVTSLATPGAFDPAAIVDAAVALLSRDGDLLRRERETWSLVAVDDAQELTAAGGRLVDLLVEGGRDVLLAGDPDAATQTFRGAVPAYLGGAPRRLRTAGGQPPVTIVLREVHRHGPPLREIACRVAARIGSAGAVGQRAASSARGGAPEEGAQVHVLASAAQEGAFVAGQLRRWHLAQNVAWSRMAVIVRSTRAASGLRRSLAAAGVPVAVPAGEVPVRNEPAVTPFLTALRCCVRPSALTPEAAVALLSGPIGGADTLFLRRLRQALRGLELAGGGARASDALLVEALQDAEMLGGVEAALASPARRVAEVLQAGRRALAQDDATAVTLLWALWEASGLAETWRRQALAGGPSGARADRDLDAVVALFEAAERFTERLAKAGPAAFVDYLDGQDLPSDTLADRAPVGESVSLLTPQAAAGQEWDVVAVVAVQEGVWPDLRLRTSLLGAQDLADLVDGRAAEGTTSVMALRRAVLDDELRLFHVAVSRARRHLLVTAVHSEEELPSPFLDLVDPCGADAGEGRVLTPVPRAPTLAGLVGELRAVVTDPQAGEEGRKAAAQQLARLAGAGVPGAHPDDWFAVGDVSTMQPLRGPRDVVSVSPSRVEAFQRCTVRWLLTSAGGGRSSSVPQALGNLIHEIANEVPSGHLEQMRALLAQRFGRLGLVEGWVADTYRRKADDMLVRLAQYAEVSRSQGRSVVGGEIPVEVRVGRAMVRGQIDRLERDADGRLHVVDFKTGASKPSREELARHPQLGVYQLAVEEGGLSPTVEGLPQSGGAALVQLGSPTKTVSVQAQQPLQADEDPTWARALVESVADGMAGADFPASAGPLCRSCDVRRSCPATSEGRQVGQ